MACGAGTADDPVCGLDAGLAPIPPSIPCRRRAAHKCVRNYAVVNGTTYHAEGAWSAGISQFGTNFGS